MAKRRTAITLAAIAATVPTAHASPVSWWRGDGDALAPPTSASAPPRVRR